VDVKNGGLAPMSTWRSGLLILGFGTGIGVTWSAPADSGYSAQIDAWRVKREERLKADGGWLTVAGLFWLDEGASRFGTASDNAVVLPVGSAPEHAGVFTRHREKVTLRLEPGVEATIEGKPVTGEVELKPDTSGEPDVVALGARLQMFVIQRGDRYGIRMKDLESQLRKDFKGLKWFPISERWRVTARFEAYTPPKSIEIPNILGQVESMQCPGAAVFSVDGHELRLEPVVEDPNDPSLFFIFRDGTTGKETYPAGRFLYTEMPKDGQVVLDFNKAYSPPCAFTPFATCPLSPPQNRLAVRVEAGEQFTEHAPAH
jgi:uncharacterized protein